MWGSGYNARTGNSVSGAKRPNSHKKQKQKNNFLSCFASHVIFFQRIRLGDRETERSGDGIQRDREKERQGNRETERQRDRETEIQRDRETERQGDRETGRQGDRETERQRDR